LDANTPKTKAVATPKATKATAKTTVKATAKVVKAVENEDEPF